MELLELNLGDNHNVFLSPSDIYKFEWTSRGGNNTDEVRVFLKYEGEVITVDGHQAAQLKEWLSKRSEQL